MQAIIYIEKLSLLPLSIRFPSEGNRKYLLYAQPYSYSLYICFPKIRFGCDFDQIYLGRISTLKIVLNNIYTSESPTEKVSLDGRIYLYYWRFIHSLRQKERNKKKKKYIYGGLLNNINWNPWQERDEPIQIDQL